MRTGASSMPRSATGVSTTTVHVSSAEAIRLAVSRSPAATTPARTGTTRLASAPPATTSNTTFGMEFAAWYVSPTQDVPTAWDRTATRPKPTTRLATVPPATPAAPAARLRVLTAAGRADRCGAVPGCDR